MFLNLRTCSRPFFVNVLDFKNVPPTVSPAFLKLKKSAPDRLPPPENGASAFSSRKLRQHFPSKIGFPSGGAFKISPTCTRAGPISEICSFVEGSQGSARDVRRSVERQLTWTTGTRKGLRVNFIRGKLTFEKKFAVHRVARGVRLRRTRLTEGTPVCVFYNTCRECLV